LTTVIDSQRSVHCATVLRDLMYIQGGPKSTDLSINRIKTCRRSYFFVEVECRTSHWGKCEQAPNL